MKVLLLPFNIASGISHKVRALKSINIDARGLAYGGNKIQTADDIKIVSNLGISNKLNQLLFLQYMYRWINWADIIHWFWKFDSVSFKLDKKLVKWCGKPGVIEWCGSDIRIPESLFPINPYYKTEFAKNYEYKGIETYKNSIRNQIEFSDVGFFPLEYIGLGDFIDKTLFPKRFRIWQSIILSEHKPNYPDSLKKKPLLLHSPSAPTAKGTKYICEAIKKLKEKYDFDFILVEGMERSKAMEIMSQCDVYIDQLILGAYGLAAVEAMAFGKPVVCYINPITGRDYPADLPIVNANPDTITEQLEILVKDAILRNKLGKQGREYVEKYHDEKNIARDLVRTYEEVIHLHTERNKGV